MLCLFKRDFKLLKRLLCVYINYNIYVQYNTRMFRILYVFNRRDYTLAVFAPHDFYMFTNYLNHKSDLICRLPSDIGVRNWRSHLCS